MTNIPPTLREKLAADPFYRACARQELLHDHDCQGDPVRGPMGRVVEWDHTLTYAGKQVQKRYAIVPLCWWAHRGPGLNRDMAVWIALNRATREELLDLSAKGGRDYFLHRAFLNRRYGIPAVEGATLKPPAVAIAY